MARTPASSSCGPIGRRSGPRMPRSRSLPSATLSSSFRRIGGRAACARSSRSAVSGSSPLINTRGAGTAGELQVRDDRAQAPAAGRGDAWLRCGALGHGASAAAAGRGRRSVRAASPALPRSTMFAMLGFECATLPAGKVSTNPDDLPLATMAGTLLAGLITLAACGAVLFLLPYEIAATSPAPFADAIAPALGSARHTSSPSSDDQRARRAQRLGALFGRGPADHGSRRRVPAIGSARPRAVGTPVRAQILSAVLAALLVCCELQRLDDRGLHLHRPGVDRSALLVLYRLRRLPRSN